MTEQLDFLDMLDRDVMKRSNSFATMSVSHCPHGVVPKHCADCSLDLDPPRARRSDPATSHQAAASAKDLANQHATQILDALDAGPAGVDRIAALTRLTCYAVSKRMVELQRAGAIKLTGKTVLSTAGRAQREWERA